MPGQQRRYLGRWAIRLAGVPAVIVVGYVSLSYLALPTFWQHYERQPDLQGRPMTTVTGQGIPGDPLNIGLVGSKTDIVKAWRAAGWHAADPITLKTIMEIAGSVVLHRPYPDAPVSNLFYDGRRQDLAFEKPVGGSAGERHHVRLWMILDKGMEDRPVWLGSATFDRAVGLSRYTGQITHHIAPHVDAERRFTIAELTRAGILVQIYQVGGVGPTLSGRNGGGDRYFTDGEITVGVIRPGAVPADALPEELPGLAHIELKSAIWSAITNALGERTH